MIHLPARLYLMRHGEVSNPGRVYYGQDDVPLSDAGRRQSLAAAQNLQDIDVSFILSSDLSRCRFMAEAIGRQAGVTPVYSKRLREVDFGQWTGLSWEQIEQRYPGMFQRRMEDLKGFRPPGGESLQDLCDRVVPEVEGALSGREGENVVVVAHGGVNRVFIASVLQMPLSSIFSLDQGLACTNVVDVFSDGIAVLRALNLPWYMEKGGFADYAVV